jgi:hypothetical protein
VSNATIRELSNMKLAKLLENRHELSAAVREEVSETSHQWGFRVGSVYIRKVHFRDAQMIHQIEEKVTNRLRQVTSAIKQDGVNQVNLISSGAERTAAVEFARAAAIRPEIVGSALRTIGEDKIIADAMFELLEVARIVESPARLTLLPAGATKSVFGAQLAAQALPAPARPQS